ncbi:hypothetical protein L1D54_10460 [Vibrio brasiliensis]|jgi:hypothetical protein|uniref:Flagellar basal-body/hook protein C-terminal domain-containing protein n=1 Tax=Vibrio brasiliensis LMG 20546 TaxID=945543 RepID=E8LQI9_9VIBR|nr:hypothetical protein [Vibrio brasiliensis]EGA67030.1 hypothetical protein VIBR0546_11457 [Vibrio brasiliensis LMG 20546]MCG9648201.1 hypothetical protein [Vibrio brasiliensis]MCG9726952.1 hypothetical protein [Vibrio brasiliensis]MCG9750902.1 hypothetical protein [Vibrio brasiliensis]MCG9783824.1 hypothetical protein [Vibrio brasiliensis]
MPVSSVQSGYQIIDMSSKMAEDAALEIQQNQQLQSISKDDSYEFNKVEFKAPAPSDIEPLTRLTSAEQYSRIGTNVLQRDQEMIGTLLDIHV